MKELPLAKVKAGDWSLNLEDEYDSDERAELLDAAADGVRITRIGCYVNIITPGAYGNPEEWFIPELRRTLEEQGLPVQEVRYIDECGCGGYVTRVFR